MRGLTGSKHPEKKIPREKQRKLAAEGHRESDEEKEDEEEEGAT